MLITPQLITLPLRRLRRRGSPPHASTPHVRCRFSVEVIEASRDPTALIPELLQAAAKDTKGALTDAGTSLMNIPKAALFTMPKALLYDLPKSGLTAMSSTDKDTKNKYKGPGGRVQWGMGEYRTRCARGAVRVLGVVARTGSANLEATCCWRLPDAAEGPWAVQPHAKWGLMCNKLSSRRRLLHRLHVSSPKGGPHPLP